MHTYIVPLDPMTARDIANQIISSFSLGNNTQLQQGDNVLLYAQAPSHVIVCSAEIARADHQNYEVKDVLKFNPPRLKSDYGVHGEVEQIKEVHV
jgi:hypothetical protein